MMMEWISVKDRLPTEQGHYLAIGTLNWAHGGCHDDNGGDRRKNMVIAFWDSTERFNRSDVTHWMPLPNPPHPKGEG